MYVLGFGVLAGAGIGFGYASATPPAVKWFPPEKTGMIAGIVVAGFGLASVYIAPLCNYLIGIKDIPTTLLILGVAFLIAVVLLSQLLLNPPSKAPASGSGAKASLGTGDFTGMEVLKTPMFYLLWLMYAFNAGAGLMVIGKLAKVVDVQAGFKAGFILVALLAIGNAGGRVLAGTASDKLGRIRVLQAFTAFQALLMFLTPFIKNPILLILFSVCIGMNYGSNLALFPSITKDFYGLKNFGINYGLIFTAWGVGSLMALVAGFIYDRYHTFNYAFFLAGILLIITILLSFAVKKPEKKSATA
jgi:OFA family oxalate/formate antiporter-like MFS transporter